MLATGGMTNASEIALTSCDSSRKQARPVSWLEHRVILEHVHRRVTGDPNTDTYQWFRQRYLPQPVPLGLSLGCGPGAFERSAILTGFAEKFHAKDGSAAAIGKARETAAAMQVGDRIEYSVCDLDEIKLPEKTYDAIFGISSVHRVANLENLFQQCRLSLKPGALLFLDDYIGPSRFQTPPKIIAIINRLLAALPARFHKNLFADGGQPIDRYIPSRIEHFLRFDASAAIRSADILDVLRHYFHIVEFRPYGGAVLHMLLSGIAGNFDESDEADATHLRMLATFERTLESIGAIPSDFAAIVARPRS